MPPETSSPRGRKDRPFGFGRLPRAFDLALRWALTLTVSVLLGFFVGRWLDLKFGTTPLFLLIGIFWGLGGSFYSIFLQLKKLEKEESEEKPPGE